MESPEPCQAPRFHVADRVWCPLPAHRGAMFCATHLIESRCPDEAPPPGYAWASLTLHEEPGLPFFWFLQSQAGANVTPRHLTRDGIPLTPAQKLAVMTWRPWWWSARRPEPVAPA